MEIDNCNSLNKIISVPSQYFLQSILGIVKTAR
jgi:hypothetical protein